VQNREKSKNRVKIKNRDVGRLGSQLWTWFRISDCEPSRPHPKIVKNRKTLKIKKSWKIMIFIEKLHEIFSYHIIAESIKSRLYIESRFILIFWQLNKSRDLEELKRDNKSTSRNYSSDFIKSTRHNMLKGYLFQPFFYKKNYTSFKGVKNCFRV